MIGRRRTLAASTAASKPTRPPAADRGRTPRSESRSCRQPNQHDEANLHEDVDVHPRQSNASQRTDKHTARRGSPPAAATSSRTARENEEHQHHAQCERAERVLLQIAKQFDWLESSADGSARSTRKSSIAAALDRQGSIVASTSPVLTPGSKAPLIAAAGNML